MTSNGSGSLAFSPNGRLLAITTGGSAVAFSPDGATLAATNGNDTIQLWSVATHRAHSSG